MMNGVCTGLDGALRVSALVCVAFSAFLAVGAAGAVFYAGANEARRAAWGRCIVAMACVAFVLAMLVGVLAGIMDALG